jgi:hypothetical protein
MSLMTKLENEENRKLPHPDIADSIKIIVEQVLFHAWNILLLNQSQYKIIVGSSLENEITNSLCKIINAHLTKEDIDGFNENNFETVIRDGKIENYNGQIIDKMPDLTFRVKGRNKIGISNKSFDGIFIECKPVDLKHTIGSKYCADGLIRFINGDYAWAMPCGMMLAYAKTNYKKPLALENSLKEKKYQTISNIRLIRSKNNDCEAVFQSIHNRNLEYPETKQSIRNITISHLWLYY